ncbi:MAG: type II toxin-antitoxin system HicB family antitoxin [Methanotrichaceae archaeon]|nr:type II toxin-antitoxin system HicB family antitoxin [Methanotrichaceae archaeon]
MRFHITFEQDEDGIYVAECVDLPGCLTEGDTIEEALENINEAIIGCLKSKLLVAGEKIKILAFSQRLDISLEVTEFYA